MDRRGASTMILGLPPTHIECRNRFTVPVWAADVHSSRYEGRQQSCAVHEIQDDKRIGTYDFSRDFPYLILGRDPAGSHIFVGHETVSPQHAALVWDKLGHCQVLNLESSMGVKLAGISVPPGTGRIILPGQELVLGKAPRSFIVACDGQVSAPRTPVLGGASPAAHLTPPPPPPPPPAYHQRSPHVHAHRPGRSPGMSPRGPPPMVAPNHAQGAYPRSPGPPMARDRRDVYPEQYLAQRREPPSPALPYETAPMPTPQAPPRRASLPMDERERFGYADADRERFRPEIPAYRGEEFDEPRFEPRSTRPRSPSNTPFADPDGYRRRAPDRREPRRSDYDRPDHERRW